MRFNYYALLFCITIISIASYSQAPNQPVNPVPPHQGGSSSVNPNLCATVSDPNGGTLQVRYFGRPKHANSGQKFTIIITPDTQYYTEEPQGAHGGNTAMFNAQTAWIANNRAARNIVYVGHLGDCVQNGDNPPGANNEIEWQRAQAAIANIESPVLTGLPQGIPFGISVGNHDQTPIGSATGTTTYYNQYFGSSHFAGRGYYGGHYGSNNDNHYQLFSASGVDFLVISFEYDQSSGFSASGGALDWAEGLVQTYSNRKVIVMTHWAINENTSFSTQGQAIYNRLKVYANFNFFFGGHVHTSDGEARRTDIFNGNRVHTILSDYQDRPGGGNGLLRILEFDPAINMVSIKTFSPVNNTFETDADSQFDLPFNMLPMIGQVNAVPSGTVPCFNWSNLAFNGDYDWDMELYDGQNITTGPVWRFTTPSGASLPVTMIGFSANLENKKTKLDWKTTNETNSDRFEIERSTDGTLFTKIGEVKSRGNATDLHSYHFYDAQPMPGKNFYRLKLVDKDTRFKYSPTQWVLLNDSRIFIAYPNPASTTGVIHIYLKNEIKGQLRIMITDMTGRELYSETKNNVQNNFQVKPGLLPGIYTIQLTGQNMKSSQKIVVSE